MKLRFEYGTESDIYRNGIFKAARICGPVEENGEWRNMYNRD